MITIYAILLVYIVYRIVRGTVHGRMWPWIVALAVLLVIVAGTVGNV